MSAKSLATLLKEPGIILAPGAYDALSAKLAARAGAAAVYMTGFGLAGVFLHTAEDVGRLFHQIEGCRCRVGRRRRGKTQDVLVPPN